MQSNSMDQESANPHPKVLIVDDEARILSSLEILLSQHGYEVDTAQGGIPACEKLASKQFDLVLLDLIMADLNGQQVMRFMAENAIDTAVIVISVKTTFDEVSYALRRGAYDYLKKPFSTKELINSAERALIKRRSEQEQEKEQARLQKSAKMQRYIMNSSPDIVFMFDRAGRFTFLNQVGESLLGYNRKALQGKHFSSVMAGRDLATLKECLADIIKGRKTRNVELKIQTSSRTHSFRHLDLTVFPVFEESFAKSALADRRSAIAESGNLASIKPASLNPKKDSAKAKRTTRLIGFYGCARDITERKEEAEFVNFQANHDPLTSLPNRNLFKDRLNMAFARARRHQLLMAVLFLDLDRFKAVNDNLGHAIGDRLLQAVTSRLQQCLREEDTLARFGGDEFILLLPDIKNKDAAAVVADKINSEIQRSFTLDQHEIFIGVSVGISVFPETGDSIDSLIQNADTAMYHVKAQGKNGYQFYDNSMDDKESNQRNSVRDLRKALEKGEFRVYYQPRINSVSAEVTGVEALVRWQHPERGIIYPAHFLPLAEDAKLIVPISEWVMQTACAEVKRWINNGYPQISLAVNFTAEQIEHPQFAAIVIELLQRYDFPAENLEIELTEKMIMNDPDRLIGNLQALSDKGTTITIDDFGTGYSSLTSLHKMPIDTLKVDRSFVEDIKDDKGACIVKAIVAMAQGLKLNIVAEGVETEEQISYLEKLGCHEFQGFFFSKAKPEKETIELIMKNADGTKKTH